MRGSYVALITPFDRKGRLDTKSLERLVEWQIAEGTDGIVCAGTTGESPTLSVADRKKLAAVCIQIAAKRIPIIVGTGTNDTRQSVRLTEQAQKLGAQGCMAVTPYYNKPTQKGCLLHFQEIAKVGLPVIIYHNPPRAVVRLTVETVIELSRIPNIAAFKDSSHDAEFVRKISPYIPVFAGDDDYTLEVIKEGAIGAISPAANFIPRGWKRYVQLCLEGKWDLAARLAQNYNALCKAIYRETNPQCIKFALSWLGRCKPIFRLPMILPTEASQQEVKKALLRLALPHFESVSARAM